MRRDSCRVWSPRLLRRRNRGEWLATPATRPKCSIEASREATLLVIGSRESGIHGTLDGFGATQCVHYRTVRCSSCARSTRAAPAPQQPRSFSPGGSGACVLRSSGGVMLSAMSAKPTPTTAPTFNNPPRTAMTTRGRRQNISNKRCERSTRTSSARRSPDPRWKHIVRVG